MIPTRAFLTLKQNHNGHQVDLLVGVGGCIGQAGGSIACPSAPTTMGDGGRTGNGLSWCLAECGLPFGDVVRTLNADVLSVGLTR